MDFGGSLDTDVLHDETFDLLCRICKRKNKNQEAAKYCVECDDYYCDSCIKVHEDVPSLTGHTILDKGQFPSRSTRILIQTSQNLPIAPTERCDRHSHYYIDMYCQNHDDVGCATCMAVEHKSCTKTFYIPEYIKNNPTSSLFSVMQQKLEVVANSFEKYLGIFQHEKQRLLIRKDNELENIRRFRKKINDRLDVMEKKSVADIEDRYKCLVVRLEESIKWLEANQTSVTSARDKVACAGNNESQDFVNAKKGEKVVSYALECRNANIQRIQKVDIDFKATSKILALLKGIDALGTITQLECGTIGIRKTASDINKQPMKTEEKHSDTGNVNQNEVPHQVRTEKTNPATRNPQEKTAIIQAVKSKRYPIKIPSDKSECDIVSACLLEDGTLILSDHNNKILISLCSSTYAVTCYYDLPGQPMHVCPISKQEVAVCLKNKREVHIVTHGYSFFALRYRLTFLKKITTEFDCLGIACANDLLYISDKKSVYICDKSGKKFECFSKDDSGQLFSDIRSLAVDWTGYRLYIVDRDKGLVVLNAHRQNVRKSSDSQSHGACDCFLGKRGIFVCGRYFKNVLHFGPDGELIGPVVNSNNSQALCCNQEMSTMIIGRSNNEIEVYELLWKLM